MTTLTTITTFITFLNAYGLPELAELVRVEPTLETVKAVFAHETIYGCAYLLTTPARKETFFDALANELWCLGYLDNHDDLVTFLVDAIMHGTPERENGDASYVGRAFMNAARAVHKVL